ncbi:hypothetical protein F3Y22_tig00001644pilonHSYRG00620 [Hibiscus syriacus]|uniref:RNase H type-1 domain-containing protein n=1 Tax=Hibiscus syriacus TaxID=106335 RepID=A0A6A3D041_HIBSY|nr:hypothetical protein F3Y22_tig00001644pilonHSYRG00620 [Hibiscus syriacus]
MCSEIAIQLLWFGVPFYVRLIIQFFSLFLLIIGLPLILNLILFWTTRPFLGDMCLVLLFGGFGSNVMILVFKAGFGIRLTISWATLIQNPGVDGQGEDELHRNQRWKLHSEGAVKVNTDDTIYRSNSRAADGGVLCDKHGRWIKGFIRSISQCDALHVELWASMVDISLVTTC